MAALRSRGTMPWGSSMGFGDGDGSDVGYGGRIVPEVEFVYVGYPAEGTAVAEVPP